MRYVVQAVYIQVQFPPLAPSRFRPGLAVRHLAPLDRRVAELTTPLNLAQRASVGSTKVCWV
jgi:hypothetical protein